MADYLFYFFVAGPPVFFHWGGWGWSGVEVDWDCCTLCGDTKHDKEISGRGAREWVTETRQRRDHHKSQQILLEEEAIIYKER